MPTTDKRPLKVFLCHAHSDAIAVRALYNRLVKDGVDAWLDKENLLPGQDWEYEIRKVVRESDVVVVCLSKQFNQRGFRQKEVRIALEEADLLPKGEIFIVPARLEECDLLDDLQRYHWVDLFDADGYERLMLSLRARALRTGAVLKAGERPSTKTSVMISRLISRLEQAETWMPRNRNKSADRISGDSIVPIVQGDLSFNLVAESEESLKSPSNRSRPIEKITQSSNLASSPLSTNEIKKEELLSSALGGEFSVELGRPRQSSDIAKLIFDVSKGKYQLTADNVLDNFGDIAYMLLRLNGKLVGVAGWHVENLVSCTTDIFLDDRVNLSKALSVLLESIEHSSKLLQCEVSLIFPTAELAKRDSLWRSLNYERRGLETLDVQAWYDAAKELLSNQNMLYFKRLRVDRVLRPI